jgi:cell division protein FtsB
VKRHILMNSRTLLSSGLVDNARKFAMVIVPAVLLLTFGTHEIFGNNGYLARRSRRAQIESLSTEIERLRKENATLTRNIKQLRSDPQAIEKHAREQLRLGRPGDVVITLPSPPVPPATR